MAVKPYIYPVPPILTRPQRGRFQGQSLWDRLFVTEDGCWQLESNSNEPYLRLSLKEGRIMAHRLFYELFRESIPKGLQIDHLCRNTWCVNPDHLEPVTSQTNNLRGEGIPAQNARKKKCLRGHNLPKEYFSSSDSRRYCTTCLDEKRRMVRWFYANRDEAIALVKKWEAKQ